MTTETELVELRLAQEQEILRLAAQGILWAIVDACDEPAVLEKVNEIGELRASCLFRGEAKAGKAAIAPYLFHLDAQLLQWIKTTLAGKPWGIFVAAQADAGTLARHFRSMLMVRGPEGNNLYFRFYDPRVLEMYLEQCNEQDTRRFYGPVRGYGVSGPGPGEVTFRVTKASASQSQQQAAIPQIEIRNEQMQYFDHKVESAQNDRLATTLAQDGKADEKLRQRVAEYAGEGRDLGIGTEAALARYIELRLDRR